jgi:hypothetical protein
VSVSTLVEPAFRSHPPFEKTLGPEVADLARLVGFDPDPEQELALDLIFAFGPDLRSVAFEIAVICSRQNLKTGVYKMAALGWLFITEEHLVVWSAHEFPTSAEAFRDISELIEGSEWLSRRVKTIYRGHGDESIELLTGQRLVFKTRTKGGGRGLTGDKVVLDEGMFLQPQHMGALLPTLSARPDPQVVYGASAGLAESGVLRGVRDRGRAGGDPRLAYLEWCDDLPGGCGSPRCAHELGAVGCRLDDVERWARSNPALGRRITVEYIAAERRAMPPEEFGRERLGWWDEPEDQVKPIPLLEWAHLGIAQPDPPPSPAGFFLDCSPGLESASVGVVALHEERPHLELADYRPGAGWLVARAVELDNRYPGTPFAVFANGAVSALLPELKLAGIEPVEFTGQDMGRACVHLQKLVAGGGVTHSRDPLFATALEAAVKRNIGDDLWTWSRRRSGDISPIVSVTGAAWLLETSPPGEPSVYVF